MVEKLVTLAEEVGPAPDEARRDVESGRHRAAAQEDAEQAARAGIRCVPFFVVDHTVAMSGAQLPGAIIDVLERAAARQQPSVEP